MVDTTRTDIGWYAGYGKRLLDICFGIPLFLVFLPLMAVVGVLVGLSLGFPVLFRQRRPGLYGKPFTLYKFRTMSYACDERGDLLADSARLEPVGSFIRKMSLDELPELWNVVKGEMSLVGPRPLLMQYLMRYTAQQARRHEVKPGVTGWAQVNGRNAVLFSKRLEMDIWYVDKFSFALDMRILFMTLLKVVRHEGVEVGQDVKEVDDIGLCDESLERSKK